MINHGLNKALPVTHLDIVLVITSLLGIGSWVDRGKKDFDFINKNTNKALTIAAGVTEGVALMAPHAIAIIPTSIYGGLKRSGLLAAIGGLFVGIYKTLSYPFRNAAQNLKILNEEERGIDMSNSAQALTPVYKQDLNNALEARYLEWFNGNQQEPLLPERPESSSTHEPVANKTPNQVPDNQNIIPERPEEFKEKDNKASITESFDTKSTTRKRIFKNSQTYEKIPKFPLDTRNRNNNPATPSNSVPKLEIIVSSDEKASTTVVVKPLNRSSGLSPTSRNSQNVFSAARRHSAPHLGTSPSYSK